MEIIKILEQGIISLGFGSALEMSIFLHGSQVVF